MKWLKDKYDINNTLDVENIQESYRKEIKETILTEYLLQGEIPSSEIVEVRFNDVLKRTPELGLSSIVSGVETTIKPRGLFWLEDYEQLIGSASIDIQAIRNIVVQKHWSCINNSIVWEKEKEETYRELRRIESTIDQLLYKDKLSDGYLHTVTEDFSDVARMNLPLSDCRIDTARQIVTLNKDTSDAVLNPDNMSVNIAIGTSSGFANLTYVSGLSNRSIIEDDNNYIVALQDRIPGRKELVVTININQVESVSGVELYLGPTSARGSVKCFVTLSSGQTKQVSVEQAYSPFMLFSFTQEQCTQVKLIFGSSDYNEVTDSQVYRYFYSIKRVKITNNTSNYRQQGSFTSRLYEVPAFKKCSLYVCDVNSDSTATSYQVSVDGENWYYITPVNKEESPVGYVVEFNSTSQRSNLSIDIEKILPGKGATALLKYDEQDVVVDSTLVNVAIINSYLPYETSVENSISVYKGYTESFSQDNSGWEVTESTVECWLHYPGGNAVTINFGHQVTVNGLTASTHIFSKKGIYRFSAPRNSYSPIQLSLPSEDAIRLQDALYPYNVKYIIEGYEYPTAYTGNKVYNKLCARSERKLTRLNNVQSLNRNSFCLVYDSTDNAYICAISMPETINEYTTHQYVCEYTVNADTYSNIYVKGELTTADIKISPVVTSYQIKTGL